MPVPSAITDLSVVAASNAPTGSEQVLPNLDNYLRAFAAFIRQNYDALAAKQAALGYTPVNRAGDTMTGALAAIKGTATAPGMSFAGDTNTGLYSPSADVLDLVTSGVSRWRVDAAGRLVHPARTHPCFRAATSASITAAGDFTTYSSESDDAANFDLSAGVFTAPVDGWYEFDASFCASPTTVGETIVAIGTNVPTYFHASISHRDASTARYACVATGAMRLSAGTTVWTTCTYAAGTYSLIQCVSFSGRLIC